MSEWLIINGVRVSSQINEDSSYAKLNANQDRHLPTKTSRQTSTTQVKNITYTPHVANSSLEVDAEVASSQGGQHRVTVLFNKVRFEPSDTPTNVTVLTAGGDSQSLSKVSLTNNTLRVRCTCLDFRFRFATWNASDNSLIGDLPPPYIRKTTTRPPVNPAKVPGVCKHIISVVKDLQKQGLVS